jgi:hypothetical protein
MPNRSWARRVLALGIGMVAAVGGSATAATRCERLLGRLAHQIMKAADTSCFESSDLTTANPNTTPADNSLAGLPAGAFTPTTGRSVISPNPPNRTPITKAVPGVQLDARIANDPAGEARILIRLPDQWNGKLVISGASGTRSEFNGDFAWSDFVLQKGYAYVSQNKGIYNLFLTAAADPLGCRLNPTSAIYVHFYANDPQTPFTRWTQYIDEAARIGGQALPAHYGRPPRRTYAVGTSNGGYQVRARSRSRPNCSTAASTGKAPLSTLSRRTC